VVVIEINRLGGMPPSLFLRLPFGPVCRGFVVQAGMRAHMVIIIPPGGNNLFGMSKAGEPVLIQAFIAE